MAPNALQRGKERYTIEGKNYDYDWRWQGPVWVKSWRQDDGRREWCYSPIDASDMAEIAEFFGVESEVANLSLVDFRETSPAALVDLRRASESARGDPRKEYPRCNQRYGSTALPDECE